MSLDEVPLSQHLANSYRITELLKAGRTNAVINPITDAPIPAGETVEVFEFHLPISNDELVSIMMPAYNAGRFIYQAIQSCLTQTYRNVEVVVVDDASTDDTNQIAAAFGAHDNRVKIYSHLKNRGEAAARNTALQHCSGRYIARLDADDWDNPSRIEKSVARLRGLPAADCVSSGMYMGREGGMVIDKNSYVGMDAESFMTGGPRGGCCNGSIVSKREIYELTGPFDETLSVGTDSDWDSRACLVGARWAVIQEPLYYYRKYDCQLTTGISPAYWYALGKQRLAKYRAQWDEPWHTWRAMEWHVTAECNMRCRFCSQENIRATHPDYHMTMDQVIEFLDACKRWGLKLNWIGLTGGEPTMWPLLEQACAAIRQSGVSQHTRVLSNCVRHDVIFQLFRKGLIDHLYTTSANAYPEGLRQLQTFGPDKVHVDQFSQFKELPREPLPDALPAECNCQRLTYIDGEIWQCANAANYALRSGRLVEFPQIHCPVTTDWVSHFRTYDRFNTGLCAYCLGNRKVWKQVPFPDGAL
jgi:glycosyltransferase involved in cell wall biosynthesis